MMIWVKVCADMRTYGVVQLRDDEENNILVKFDKSNPHRS